MRARLLLALVTGICTLAAIEGALWAFHPLAAGPHKLAHRFLPGYHAMAPAPRVIEFDPGPLPNVTPGIRHIHVNRYGYCYPEEQRLRSSPDEVRIAAIGGSTVECSALTEDNQWPAVLENLLQRALPERPITVLNLGLSAMDTRTHLATMCQHVTSLDVDVVVFMLGANDLSRVGEGELPLLSPDNFYVPTTLSRELASMLRQTQIGRHRELWKSQRRQVPRTTPYFLEQAEHQAALPELEAPLSMSANALAGYARNIVSLAGICREHGIAAVFTTQPTMLTAAPTAAEQAVLWGFHLGSHRLSAANFVDLLGALNQRLIETCAARGYACVDLAAAIPKGLGCYYDQVHFTDTGARRVAETLLLPIRELIAQRTARR